MLILLQCTVKLTYAGSIGPHVLFAELIISHPRDSIRPHWEVQCIEMRISRCNTQDNSNVDSHSLSILDVSDQTRRLYVTVLLVYSPAKANLVPRYADSNVPTRPAHHPHAHPRRPRQCFRRGVSSP